MRKARKLGRVRVFRRFAKYASESHAVLCMNISFAHEMVTNSNWVYVPYGVLRAARARLPMPEYADRTRSAIDGGLYGSFCDGRITYAALSTNGFGTDSYGPVHVRLNTRTIDFRATVYEGNTFRKEHYREPRDIVGRLASWEDRGRLAAVKAIEMICNDDNFDFENGLLSPGPDKMKDEYIEVHIYGSFDLNSVDGVSCTVDFAQARPIEQLMVQAIEDYVISRNIEWKTI
ncbi:MAG: hypothetical protein IH621_01905 [Krumholzibacteria bacterium]|nr:hypothetical protein [Candidatus Krumholzibacteria bacterium]